MTQDSSAAAALVSVVVLLVALALELGIYLWYAAALSKLFAKSGVDSWRGWVPILNEAEILRLGGQAPWMVVFYFIPVVNIYGIVLRIMATHKINTDRGRGAGYTVLAVLLPPVWATLLAWGRSAVEDGEFQSRVSAGLGGPHTGPLAQQQAPQPFPDAVSAGAGGGYRPADPIESPPVPPAQQVPAPQPLPPVPQPVPPPAQEDPYAAIAAHYGSPSGAIVPAPPPAPAAPPPAPADPAPATAPVAAQAPAAPAPAPSGSSIFAPPGVPVPPAPSIPSVASVLSAPPEQEPVPEPEPEPIPVPEPIVEPVPEPEPEPIPVLEPIVEPVPEPEPEPIPVPEPIVEPEPEPVPEPAPAIRIHNPWGPEGAAAAPVVSPFAPPGEVVPPPAPRPVAAPPAPAAAPAVGDPVDDEEDGETVVIDRRPRPSWELVLDEGTSYPLAASTVVLGRRPSGDDPAVQYLPVSDTTRTLSKQHARLELGDEGWSIVDLNSTNGVLVGDDGEETQLDAWATAPVEGVRFVLGKVGMRIRRLES